MTKLHGTDIYAGFDASLYPDDTQGWNSEHPLLMEAIRVIRPSLVIEVGVWKGASTIFMAEQLRAAGLESSVLAVDTFLGSITHLTRPESRASLAPRHGWPQLYYLFLANVIRRKLENYIVPFPQTSDTAFQLMQQMGLRPQLVHIDAAHDYESVARDLANYYSLLAPGGALVGDDFTTHWPEVVWAATEFAKRHQLNLQQLSGKFLLQKPNV
ncbi:MAG: class I SAM-dependent methyltransferase [Sulfuritalea sp.]|nr:class I SAM-dependent methyltransferase [Sulfuritalea sp.]